MMVMHHIISDGVSMQILIDELAARYLAHVKAKHLRLMSCRIKLCRLCHMAAKVAGRGRERQAVSLLARIPGQRRIHINLPVDHPRQPVAAYQAARYFSICHPMHWTDCADLAQDRGATLFMVLLAGFQALLYRHTGQHDIRVGVPVANRNRIETAGLIGFFVNTQVMRSRNRWPHGTCKPSGPGEGSCHRCAGTPGFAIRATGGSIAAGAKLEPQPAVSGNDQSSAQGLPSASAASRLS